MKKFLALLTLVTFFLVPNAFADNYDLRAQDSNGNWRPVKLDASGQVKVSLQGVTGFTSDFLGSAFADDQIFVADSTDAGTPRTLPDCDDSGGSHLNYDQTTNSFTCGTSSASSGGWTDGGTDITNTTPGDNVGIGAASFAKLSITGDTDEAQFGIKFNATQTSTPVAWKTQAGTNVYSWTATGTYTQAGTDTDAATFGGGTQATYVSTYNLSGTDVTATASSGTMTFSGALASTTLDTGQGANELYDMNQNVQTSDSPTFADVTVTTEVYDATGWNGDNTVPTKDAVRDKIETISAGSASTVWAQSTGTSQTATHYYGMPNGAANTSEASSQNSILPTAGTISKLYAHVQTAPGVGKSWAYTARINSVDDSTLTCTISDTATDCNDTTGTISVAAGDKVTIRATASGTPTGITTGGVTCVFTPS